MRFLIIIILTISLHIQSFGCSCIARPGFCETFQNEKEYSIVIFGKVISHYEHGAYVEVIENIYGAANKDTVIVWGDPGHLCRTYPGNVGDSMVYILYILSNTSWDELEQPGDYGLSGCGSHKLKYSSGLLIGNYTSPNSFISNDTINYKDFADNIEACEYPLKISFHPNPAVSSISIKSSENIVDIIIYDLVGNKIFTEIVDKTDFDVDLSKYELSHGIYVAVLNTAKGKRAVRKILYAGD